MNHSFTKLLFETRHQYESLHYDLPFVICQYIISGQPDSGSGRTENAQP